MNPERSQTEASTPSVASPLVPLTIAAVERLNSILPKPSDDAFDRWLCEILLQHSSDFESLTLVAPDLPDWETLSIASEPEPIAPSQGPAAGITREARTSGSEASETLPTGSDDARPKWISLAHQACARSIKRLDESEIPQILRDNIGRFRVWTANSGAHRLDKLSLDHRLRESIKLKKTVIDLLVDLNSALQEGELPYRCRNCAS